MNYLKKKKKSIKKAHVFFPAWASLLGTNYSITEANNSTIPSFFLFCSSFPASFIYALIERHTQSETARPLAPKTIPDSP